MYLLDVLRHDVEHNQDGLSLEDAIETYQDRLKEGFVPFIKNDTLFLLRFDDDVVFYHSINAAPRQAYIDNIYYLVEVLRSKGYKAAYTELTNPKLKAFVKRYFKDSIIIDDYSIMFFN